MKKILLCCLSVLWLFCLFTCNREDDFITTPDVQLEFSLDTLRFDTVFTELGSATRFFKVYNRNDRPVKINRVYLQGNAGSPFRLNIDGLPGNEAEEVIVWAEDSIYVFAEVTIDPDQPVSASPFVIEEQVVFETNTNVQRVNLEAWGQNANYFPSRFNKGVTVEFSCGGNEITWDDPKPYVIYGRVIINDCTLNIPPGTNIHVHGGIARDSFSVFNDGLIFVAERGRMNILGTPEEPVTIQGDRLEEGFQNAAGQWTGLVFGKGSTGNIVSHATIKNSIIGIYADSASTVTIENSQIYNTNGSGLIGFNSQVTAVNTLIYNNGGNGVQILLGGNYTFDHCTIASYGVDAAALSMFNFFCYDNFLECLVLRDARLRARFRNSIIFGSRQDEIVLADIFGGQGIENFDISFQNCIVRVDELLEEQDLLYAEFLGKECNPCTNGDRDDIIFADPNEDDYRLDSLSIAIGQATPISSITVDLEGNPRDSEPDIGCFERQN